MFNYTGERTQKYKCNKRENGSCGIHSITKQQNRLFTQNNTRKLIKLLLKIQHILDQLNSTHSTPITITIMNTLQYK